MPTVLRWNDDKPHRCPNCHAVAISTEEPSPAAVYTCCTCAARFSRFPNLAPMLRDAGIACSEHGLASRPSGDR